MEFIKGFYCEEGEPEDLPKEVTDLCKYLKKVGASNVDVYKDGVYFAYGKYGEDGEPKKGELKDNLEKVGCPVDKYEVIRDFDNGTAYYSVKVAGKSIKESISGGVPECPWPYCNIIPFDELGITVEGIGFDDGGQSRPSSVSFRMRAQSGAGAILTLYPNAFYRIINTHSREDGSNANDFEGRTFEMLIEDLNIFAEEY